MFIMLTLFITMLINLASILFPIHWLTRLVNILILIRLIYALAMQVTWKFVYPLHLVTK